MSNREVDLKMNSITGSFTFLSDTYTCVHVFFVFFCFFLNFIIEFDVFHRYGRTSLSVWNLS